ncbi:MAG TPA: ABC transporter ATP-binding protein [Longimicrobiales bacterium]
MAEHAVRTDGLTRRYGDVTAVDGVSLRVGRGEVYALLGLNGAGKSTTMRLLLGMVRPSAGSAEVLGTRVSASASEVWRRVGHLVESATAYPELAVRENVRVAALLHGVRDEGPIVRVIELLGLGEYERRRARTLSQGNLQRLALAMALVHEPELLLLDEPISSLDPAGVVEIRELLRNLARERGTTVIVSSHILSEVERLATRIGILHRGRLIQELGAAELDALRERRLEIRTHDAQRAAAALREAGWQPESGGHGTITLREAAAVGDPAHIATLLVNAGTPPVHLAVAHDDIEQYFLRLVSS